MKYVFIMTVFGLIASVSGQDYYSTQTDWTGGPGVEGPVLDFGTEFYNDTAVLYWGNEDLSLLAPGEVNVTGFFYYAYSLASKDMDGDGDNDIICSSGYTDLAWWENTSWENTPANGSYWQLHYIDTSIYNDMSISVEDIDGDGDYDVAAIRQTNDEIVWCENMDGSGTTWEKHVLDAFDSPRSVCCEDMDGDGDIDVIACSMFSDSVAIWENIDSSGSSWVKHTVGTDFGWGMCVYASDVDGDGLNDVVAAGLEGGISLWINPGELGGAWEEQKVASSYEGASFIRCGDIDGDGDCDILGASQEMYDISWWENTPGTPISWLKRTIDTNVSGCSCAETADIDGDGDLDIAGTAMWGAEASWWENSSGSGTDWIEHVFEETLTYPTTVCLSDLNGDGLPDAIISSYVCSRINWWNLNGFAPVGYLISSILDTQCNPDEAFIDWSSLEPESTSIFFQYRTSNTPSSMGNWSDPIYEPTSLAGPLEQYVQYRVALNTFDCSTSPTLEEITISWNTMGISEDDPNTSPGRALLPIAPNPSAAPVVRYSLDSPSDVELIVYDISGRTVFRFQDESPAGNHSLAIEDCEPGVYFCCMTSGDFSVSQRFVVIE